VVPPEGVAVAVPLEPPKQLTFVPEALALRAEEGVVMVTVSVSVHALASVAVTV
jgi:hypothetical protein